MAIGLEPAYGVAPPPDQMRSIGGSTYGSSFFVASPVRESKWHVRTRRTRLNWLPIPLAQRLVLILMSINNVIGCLRCDLGIDPTTVTFQRPISASAFDEVWSRSPGITSSTMDSTIHISPAAETSRESLKQVLKGASRERWCRSLLTGSERQGGALRCPIA